MMIRLTSVLLALSMGLSACSPSVSTRDGVGDPQRLSLGQSVDIASVGTRVSALRARNGLARPLGHSAALQAAAQAHADDMARSGTFAHTGSTGSTLQSRTRAAGYNACFSAENIAHGQANIAQVFEDWMTSDGHRRNILAAEATQFGFARNGTYSVLVLGRSC
jgi:uncharacterized protein YkwD